SLRRAEERIRLERELVALARLLADREEAHLRVGDSEDLLGEDRSHVAELEQVLGSRVGIRTRVEHDAEPAPGRHDDRDRGPIDAGQATELEQARGEHGAGVACRDDSVGIAGADCPASGDERAVRLPTYRLARLLVHLDHVWRLDELEAARVEASGP